MLTALAAFVTSGVLIFSETSTPSNSTLNPPSFDTKRIRVERARDATAFAFWGLIPFLITLRVIARYIAPVSTCKYPRRDATSFAVVLLPEAAGPSMAMMSCFKISEFYLSMKYTSFLKRRQLIFGRKSLKNCLFQKLFPFTLLLP